MHVLGYTPNHTSFRFKYLIMNYQLKNITTPYFTLMAIITLTNYNFRMGGLGISQLLFDTIPYVYFLTNRCSPINSSEALSLVLLK